MWGASEPRIAPTDGSKQRVATNSYFQSACSSRAHHCALFAITLLTHTDTRTSMARVARQLRVMLPLAMLALVILGCADFEVEAAREEQLDSVLRPRDAEAAAAASSEGEYHSPYSKCADALQPVVTSAALRHEMRRGRPTWTEDEGHAHADATSRHTKHMHNRQSTHSGAEAEAGDTVHIARQLLRRPSSSLITAGSSGVVAMYLSKLPLIHEC